jgi:hypothetical protein
MHPGCELTACIMYLTRSPPAIRPFPPPLQCGTQVLDEGAVLIGFVRALRREGSSECSS